MKKYIKWSGIALLSPFAIFLLLCILIYIPPIQKFLVDQATGYASEATGMKIGIDKISLSFPLDLVVHDVDVTDSIGEKILRVDEIKAEIQLWPLLKKEIELDGLSLKGATVNTGQLIEGMSLKGKLGEFFIASHGVALDPETAIINEAVLKDTRLSVVLNDTTAADTAQSDPLYWKVILQKINFSNVAVDLQMPADSLNLSAYIGDFLLQDGKLDLNQMAYEAKTIRLTDGTVNYDSGLPTDSLAKGLDPSHIRLSGINTQLDSLYYSGNTIRASINQFTLKERSGLEITSAKGSIASNDKVIRIPDFHLQTSDSFLELEAAMDWDATQSGSKGLISGHIAADLGKSDLIRLAGELPQEFMKSYPSQPLRIRGGIDGNLDSLKLSTLTVTLPETFRMEMNGEIASVTDSLRRSGTVRLKAEAENMAFLHALTGNTFVIPYGTAVEGSGSIKGNQLTTQLSLTEKQGTAKLTAGYNLFKDSYNADLDISNLQLHNFLPQDSLFHLTTHLVAEGEGFDVFSPKTWMKVEGGLSHLQYGTRILSGVHLEGELKESNAVLALDMKDNIIDLSAKLNSMLHPKSVTADLNVAFKRIDWKGLNLTKTQLSSSHLLQMHAETDMKKSHKLNLGLTQSRLMTPESSFSPKDLYVRFTTTKDTTYSTLDAGDMHLAFSGDNGIERLGSKFAEIASVMSAQWQHKHIDMGIVRTQLPNIRLQLSAGTDNPISNTFAAQGIKIKNLTATVNASPEYGFNSNAQLLGLSTDSLSIDTIFFRSDQVGDSIVWRSGVQTSAKKKQEAFSVILNGNIGNKEAKTTIEYLNGKKEVGAYIGLIAALHEKGISLRVYPDNPILVYRPFKVNKDNYFYLSDKGRMHANMTIYDEKYTGIRLYSVPDSTVQQDLTLELHNIRMSEFRRIIPYMPDIRGEINSELHYVLADNTTQVSADLSIGELAYEGHDMGDWEFSGVYLPKNGNEHHIDGYLIRNGEEIATLGGSYLASEDPTAEGRLLANMDLHHFPLHLANAFVPDDMVRLSGDIDGNMSVKGSASKPLMNGSIILDSVNLALPMASMNLRFDDKPVKVVDSKLNFNNFKIFTKGKTPFTIDGDVDFSDMERMTTNLKMQAHNFELFNAPKSKEALVYGKLYVDFNATLKGPVNALTMRGGMNVLGNSNFTYVLKDSPLSVTDRLNQTVTFVNFADTTLNSTNAVPKIELGTLDMLMVMQIDQAVQCRVDLTEDRSNYLLFEGGGNLSFQYTQQGNMLLNGRYTLISGEMKYEMPIIPLKTFYIKEGSFVEWTGDIMNPNLNLKATERVRASVGSNGKSPRNVSFDVGVRITNRLENLGLAFTLEAPDDGEVQNQLAAMSDEEKNKLAVTMLVTGMYMAEGNSTGSFNTNNALNSFLQGQINNIAGNALKTIDLNVGMESTSQEDGSNRTDYNFQFAKRFWNNRFRVVIGGRISTGNNVKQNENFIDNVSLEYRLDNSGTRYVKIFHNKNYESILEGEVIETGAGIVLRKKVSRVGELFIFRKKKKNNQEAVIEEKKKTNENTEKENEKK